MKKIASFLLIVILCISMFPIASFAGEMDMETIDTSFSDGQTLSVTAFDGAIDMTTVAPDFDAFRVMHLGNSSADTWEKGFLLYQDLTELFFDYDVSVDQDESRWITVWLSITNRHTFSAKTIEVEGVETKTYNGKAQKQKNLSLWDAENYKLLTEGKDYKITYQNNVSAGTATMLLKGIGTYKGSFKKTFKISPKKVTPVVKLSKNSCVYNKKTQKPSVTVSVGGKKLARSAYTVSYSKGSKKVGTYKVTVRLKGNYKGKKTAKFTIAPKGISLSSVTAETEQAKIKWKKQAAQTSGYQVQYSTSSAFKSGVKTITVNGAKKTNTAIKNLKGGKKYYVRVRTFKKVSGKKYYSAWSKSKTVTPKKPAPPKPARNKSAAGLTENESGGSSDNPAPDSDGGVVYWTPSGTVYHYSRSCSTLARSKTVYSGTIAQSGKPRGCKVCGH